MIVVACITFGHDRSDIEACLSSARELAEVDSRLTVISVDDHSGRANGSLEIIHHVTPSRRGFPAVVQYIVEDLYPNCTRLILVNPDACVGAALKPLLEAKETVAVPSIGDHGFLHNVRLTTTAGKEFRNLLFGESRSGWPLQEVEETRVVSCPPFAPSGAVISVDAQALRAVPLDANLFWLEFSDWTRRRQQRGLDTTLRILPERSEHTGASTSVKYPLSVASSQARAKVHFIRRYGRSSLRVLLPIAVLSKAVRFGISRRNILAAVFLFRAAFDAVDWRVSS